MSSVPVVRDVKVHLQRADGHETTGNALRAVSDEWFSVAYFYSAYHLVKAAMNVDPIFGSATSLAKIDPHLTIEGRFAEHHSGGFGKNGRTLGVNDVVFKLYPGIRVAYTRLHMASCHVRYGHGLTTLSPQAAFDDFQVVRKAYHEGAIVAAS